MSFNATIPRPLHRPAALLSLALMLSLLFTQWLGYAHLIAHLDGVNESIRIERTKAGVPDHQKTASACVAFDAATLGAGLHTPDIILAVLPAASYAPQVVTPAGHAPAFFAHFASRAPPLTT